MEPEAVYRDLAAAGAAAAELALHPLPLRPSGP